MLVLTRRRNECVEMFSGGVHIATISVSRIHRGRVRLAMVGPGVDFKRGELPPRERDESSDDGQSVLDT